MVVGCRAWTYVEVRASSSRLERVRSPTVPQKLGNNLSRLLGLSVITSKRLRKLIMLTTANAVEMIADDVCELKRQL